MNTALSTFASLLDEKELKYDISDDGKALIIKFTGEHGAQYTCLYIFNDNCADVSLRIYSIATIPSDKLSKGYELCSELNRQWRWLKFYLDSDKEVTAEIDAVIEPRTVGDECLELLYRTLDILDHVYPDIMKLVWGGSGVSAPQKK